MALFSLILGFFLPRNIFLWCDGRQFQRNRSFGRVKEISLRVLCTNSVGHKTELIRCTLSQYCDYDIVKKSVGMSLVNLRIFAKYYYESPTSEHSCWADEPIGRHWNCLFKKDGGKTKSSVLQMLFYGRRIITTYVWWVSFLMLKLVHIFCSYWSMFFVSV